MSEKGDANPVALYGAADDDDVGEVESPVFDEPDPEDKTVMHVHAVASVQTTSINIISNVVGAGLLTIPGAFASMGVIAGTAMLSLFAAMSSYSMLLLTCCAQRTGRFTYKDLIEYAWGKSLYGRLFDGVIFLYTFACCIAYAKGVGDAMPPVMRNMIGHDSAVTTSWFWILMASIIFFPLSSLKQLSELKVSSLFGFIVIVYLVVVVVVYFFWEESPSGGRVNEATPWTKFDSGFILNVPICSVAFSCHYNIPAFYGEMEKRSPIRMMRAVLLAVPTIFGLYLITAYFAVMHFNPKSLTENGDVSSDFPDQYKPMAVARVGLFIHFVCVFPIICLASRRAFNSIVFNRGNMSQIVYVAEAFGLVSTSCIIAWASKSVLQVFDVSGALFGIMIVVVLPNLLYLKIVPDAETADLVVAHGVTEEGELLGGGNHLNRGSTRGSNSARRSSIRRSSARHSTIGRVARRLDDLVVERPREMTYIGRFLILLGVCLSIGSFAIQIYKDADPSKTPSPPPPATGMPSPAPNRTNTSAPRRIV